MLLCVFASLSFSLRMVLVRNSQLFNIRELQKKNQLNSQRFRALRDPRTISLLAILTNLRWWIVDGTYARTSVAGSLFMKL